MSQIIKQLKSLKHHPKFGGVTQAETEAAWEKISKAISAHANQETELVVAGGSYVGWVLSQYISKPVMAGAFSLVLVAGGWLTTVRAADSLPGQTLYSIKKITEQAQLKLASLDRKAVLHTEFAGRRLQEISDLQEGSTDQTVTDPLVKETIEAYKQEVNSAADSLHQLQDEGGVGTLATATSVQANLQAINTSFDAVVGVTTPATQDVIDAKAVTKEVEDAATEVLVEVHEQDQSDLSANELKQIFKTDLGEIEARKRFDLERIGTIRLALEDEGVDYTTFDLPTADELLSYEFTITSSDDDLSEAMTFFAIGGYRTAFEMMQEIDQSLLDLEATLASVEINIMTARAQTPTPEIEIDVPTEIETPSL